MAWIESHTVIFRHRKLVMLADLLKINRVLALGHIHLFWHSVLEQQEDGDLSKWTNKMISDVAQWRENPTVFVESLQKSGFLDGKKVHDWLDYAGRYLNGKYRTSNKKKLASIYRKHKIKSVLSRTKDGLKSDLGLSLDSPPYLPNLPNLPNLPDHAAAAANAGTPSNPQKKELTTVQKIVLAYKVTKGFKKDDKGWDALNFKRFTKSAKQLVDYFKEPKLAVQCIVELADKFNEKNLDWTLETIVKHAADWKAKEKGHETNASTGNVSAYRG